MPDHIHAHRDVCTAACPAHIDYEGADRCEAEQPCDCCAPSEIRRRVRQPVERVTCSECGRPTYELDKVVSPLRQWWEGRIGPRMAAILLAYLAFGAWWVTR